MDQNQMILAAPMSVGRFNTDLKIPMRISNETPTTDENVLYQ